MFAELLPAEVLAVDMIGDDPTARLLPEEEFLVANAVRKRRTEVTNARTCARRALVGIGRPENTPILRGAKGEPLWPRGVVGSITHTTGYYAAAVADASKVRSVGMDAEVHGELPQGVLAHIAFGAELAMLADLDRMLADDGPRVADRSSADGRSSAGGRPGVAGGAPSAGRIPAGGRVPADGGASTGGGTRADGGTSAGGEVSAGGLTSAGAGERIWWDRLLFSAKESVYKAWFPLTGRWLGFEDAEVIVQPAAHTFTARILIDGTTTDGGPPLTRMSGRWLVRDGFVLTAITLPVW